MIRYALLFLAALLLAFPALAVGVDPQPLADPAQEARARALMHELRCLVCQNQSISDSDAPLATDLRQIVRERVDAGDSDDAIRAYLVARYGDWILLKPPFKPGTLLLWLGPLLVFSVALALLLRRRRGVSPEPAPLSSDERAALEDVMRR
jgi:cytochrome c-type biogenesis protein CcmH